MKGLKIALLILGFVFIVNTQAQTIEVITQERSKGVINRLVYNSNGTLIASTSENDPTVKVWDLRTNSKILSKKIYLEKIIGLKIFDGGNKIVTAGGDGIVHFWNLDKLTESKHIKVSAGFISVFDANVTKNMVAVDNKNKSVKICSFKGNLLYDFKAKTDDVNHPIKAKRKILIMDTCHSGEIDKEEVFFSEEDEQQEDDDIEFRAAGPSVGTKETNASPSKVMNELFNDLRKGTGATVISYVGGTEYAMESSEWKNGLFTYYMLMGIKNGKADLNQDGNINLTELQTYVTEKVKALSHGKQIPNTRIQNLELDFRVW